MSNLIPEGTYSVRIVGAASFGKNEKDELRARINVQIADGDFAGRRMTYDERLDGKSEKYVRRSLTACGWKGKTFASVAADIVDGTETTAEVIHLTVKEGKRAGEAFFKIRGLGGQPPLVAPTINDISEADSMFIGSNDDAVPF